MRIMALNHSFVRDISAELEQRRPAVLVDVAPLAPARRQASQASARGMILASGRSSEQ